MAETKGEGGPAGERSDKARRDEAGGDGARGDEARVIIKKYANRRLYNTAKSSYVTLDDLARMVRAGEDFAVFDAKTGEDITRSVLTQIIVEEEGRDHMLPTGFLRELIRLYGDPMQRMVPGYLNAAMETFRQNQERLGQAFGGKIPMDLEQLARTNMDLFERSMRMFSPFGSGMGGQGSGGQGARGQASGGQASEGQGGEGQGGGPGKREPEPAREERRDRIEDDLDALQKQLREMQVQLERLSRSRK